MKFLKKLSVRTIFLYLIFLSLIVYFTFSELIKFKKDRRGLKQPRTRTTPYARLSEGRTYIQCNNGHFIKYGLISYKYELF